MHISALAAEINKIGNYGKDQAWAGLLNYSVTKLTLQVMPARKYWVVAMVSGVLHNIADEFYRRFAAPYEDEKIAENGDVYDG